MADDRFSDSRDESDEPTSTDSARQGAAEETSTPAELTESGEIVDPEDSADDAYVDDPTTTDINEAKLDRATDDVADDVGVEDAGVEDAAGATPARRGSGRTRTTAPVRKKHIRSAEAGTPATPGTGRTTPVKFVAESVGELRKVVWPTGSQLQQYFVVVLVFVLFIMTFVSLLDLGFGWVILRVFG